MQKKPMRFVEDVLEVFTQVELGNGTSSAGNSITHAATGAVRRGPRGRSHPPRHCVASQRSQPSRPGGGAWARGSGRGRRIFRITAGVSASLRGEAPSYCNNRVTAERLNALGIEAVDFWRGSHPSCGLSEFPDVARLRRTFLCRSSTPPRPSFARCWEDRSSGAHSVPFAPVPGPSLRRAEVPDQFIRGRGTRTRPFGEITAA